MEVSLFVAPESCPQPNLRSCRNEEDRVGAGLSLEKTVLGRAS